MPNDRVRRLARDLAVSRSLSLADAQAIMDATFVAAGLTRGRGLTMVELERRRCPDCDSVFDVWLANGHPESERGAFCPDCLEDGVEAVGVRDDGENAIFQADE